MTPKRKGKFVDQLCAVARSFQNQVDKEARMRSVHPSYLRIIRVVAENPGILQYEIAKETNLSAPTISLTLTRMQNEGYINRTTDGEDKRLVRITLTEKGKKAEKDRSRSFSDCDKKILENITDEEIEIAFPILEKMLKNFEE